MKVLFMIIAVLFNANDSSFGCDYGTPIQKKILSSGILQNSNRNIKVGMGDLLIRQEAKSKSEQMEAIKQTLFLMPKDFLLIDELCHAIAESDIFACVIQNVTETIMIELHKLLKDYPPYLGSHVVDFSLNYHFAFYQYYIGEKYRIRGNICSLFFSEMGGDEKPYWHEEELLSLGFENIDFEDVGFRLSLLDDYQTIEHYKKVKEFTQLVSNHIDNYAAFELSMTLNDINPPFFNVFNAMLRSLNDAKNKEDIAQVCLSARRYFEQLADILFEPQDELYRGRKVKSGDYKNRIWAFISDNLEGKDNVKKLGTKLDDLIKIFNKGLHDKLTLSEISSAILELARFSGEILSLKPLYKEVNFSAYQEAFDEMICSIAEPTEQV
jgi:hypothetical protein